MTIYIKIIKDLSFINKYFYWWEKIIIRGINRANTKIEAKEILGYVEGHHILPKSFDLGGHNDKSNIVFLTAKEHIMVHRLMCKFILKEYRIKSLRAYHCMIFKNNGGNNKRYVTLHQLATARQAASEANSVKRGMNGVPSWFTESDNIFEFEETLREFVANNYSDPKIAKIYGVSAQAIYNWRKKLKIDGGS